MDRFEDYKYPPITNKLRPEQIAQASTWARVADADTAVAAVHIIHVVPSNGTTVTYLNPLDPGDQSNHDWYDHKTGYDSMVPAGRPL